MSCAFPFISFMYFLVGNAEWQLSCQYARKLKVLMNEVGQLNSIKICNGLLVVTCVHFIFTTYRLIH